MHEKKLQEAEHGEEPCRVGEKGDIEAGQPLQAGVCRGCRGP